MMNGEIIEDYPKDFPYHSCLIIGKTDKDKILHLVCAIGDDKLWIVTAYEPSTTEWEADFRVRRRKT